MVLSHSESRDEQRLVAQLLGQLQVIDEHMEYLRQVMDRVQAMEQRYGIASADIHSAIEAGEIRETLDVCNWIMDYEILKRSWGTDAGRSAWVE